GWIQRGSDQLLRRRRILLPLCGETCSTMRGLGDFLRYLRIRARPGRRVEGALSAKGRILRDETQGIRETCLLGRRRRADHRQPGNGARLFCRHGGLSEKFFLFGRVRPSSVARLFHPGYLFIAYNERTLKFVAALEEAAAASPEGATDDYVLHEVLRNFRGYLRFELFPPDFIVTSNEA